MSEIKRKTVSHLLKEAPGGEVLAKGWVRTKRGNKNVAFIALNDGSSVNNIQVVCDTQNFSEELLKEITTGACIAGFNVSTAHNGATRGFFTPI